MHSSPCKTYLFRLLPAIFLVPLLLMLFSGPALAADDKTQLLINKTYPLAADAVPEDLVYLDSYISAGSDVRMTEQAALALQEMVAAARQAGVYGIYGASGYRSYDLQSTLYANKTAYYRGLGYTQDEAKQLAATVVAPPGMSEHQSGMAIDITTAENGHSMTESFADTEAGRWLAANCWKYGYILRYPQDKTEITGYIYEPWHFRYVGKPHAEYMMQHGLTLEEYYQQLQREGVLLCTSYEHTGYQIYYSAHDISPTLPGVCESVSQTTPSGNSYLITMRAAEDTLYDLFGHWSEPEVRELVELGIINGYPDNTFRPETNINRAELITLVARTYQLIFPTAPAAKETAVADAAEREAAAGEMMAESTPDATAQETESSGSDAAADELPAEETSALVFQDVTASDYFYESLMLTWRAGLLAESLYIEQDGQLYFDAQRAVLRREVAESLAPLFAALKEAEPSGIEFSDLTAESDTVRAAAQLLADYGIMKGDDLGRFLPNSYLKRAELSAMLIRIIHYYEAMDGGAAVAAAGTTAEGAADANE